MAVVCACAVDCAAKGGELLGAVIWDSESLTAKSKLS